VFVEKKGSKEGSWLILELRFDCKRASPSYSPLEKVMQDWSDDSKQGCLVSCGAEATNSCALSLCWCSVTW
jgi:hypothetical protein